MYAVDNDSPTLELFVLIQLLPYKKIKQWCLFDIAQRNLYLDPGSVTIILSYIKIIII